MHAFGGDSYVYEVEKNTHWLSAGIVGEERKKKN